MIESSRAAADIAEFVWFSSHFDASRQAEMLQQFIAERGVPDEMVPWLIEVFAELSERKMIMAG
ncbi:MAG: hypothetical protein R3A46_06470 [Thermomicrobiales bacterium]